MTFLRLPALLLLLLAPLCQPSQAEILAKHHMAAAANPYAAKAALDMLRQGGSAVDAAIAAQMVLTLVEPESSGLGGGAFMLLWDPAKKKITSFDGRETAPASATPGMFLDAGGKPRAHLDAIPGGLSVGVPGVVAMLELAHRKYGKLPWQKLFAPAIALATNGVPVGHKLAATLREFPKVSAMPDIKRAFAKPDGTLLNEGDILKNPALAATLQAIATGGAKAFYSGPIARAIVDKVQHAPVNPGGMRLADLARYRARERAPVCGEYRGDRVCSMGPPSSGGIAVLQILHMLERFPSRDLAPNSLSEVHLFSQASRLAFADRASYLGDPDFVRLPVKSLLGTAYLRARSRLIDPARDMGQAAPGNLADFAPQKSPELHGTSHMSIVDDAGEVVSMTTTVEYVFGSEMTADGFILNNELTDFSFVPTVDGKPVANAPAPGKRPMSAMSPTIVFDKRGRFAMALGSPGGPAIIPYVAETLVAMIDGGLRPQEAAALPHHVNTNGPLFLEKDTSLDGLAPALAKMGYDVRPGTQEKSGLHIIERVRTGYIGGADPRRDGVAIGD
ncbi:MAG: gamma-glutamyltransferase [Alphaproteobacteria bacterium]|nr:gamma-glutamyltransferase [Alphaproteobacteria bacterium]MDE2629444.1 gamma-glutamyltransferase [Alphaproteobacteria bacterium]